MKKNISYFTFSLVTQFWDRFSSVRFRAGTPSGFPSRLSMRAFRHNEGNETSLGSECISAIAQIYPTHFSKSYGAFHPSNSTFRIAPWLQNALQLEVRILRARNVQIRSRLLFQSLYKSGQLTLLLQETPLLIVSQRWLCPNFVPRCDSGLWEGDWTWFASALGPRIVKRADQTNCQSRKAEVACLCFQFFWFLSEWSLPMGAKLRCIEIQEHQWIAYAWTFLPRIYIRMIRFQNFITNALFFQN